MLLESCSQTPTGASGPNGGRSPPWGMALVLFVSACGSPVAVRDSSAPEAVESSQGKVKVADASKAATKQTASESPDAADTSAPNTLEMDPVLPKTGREEVPRNQEPGNPDPVIPGIPLDPLPPVVAQPEAQVSPKPMEPSAPQMGTAAPRPRTCQGQRRVGTFEFARVGSKALQLDLTVPAGGTGPWPLIIWIHGGAWQGGSRASPYPVAQSLVGECFALASVDYRLSQEAVFPAQIQDVKAAVRYLRAHAGKHGLDEKRFVAFGPSAGGHLVALLAASGRVTEFDDPKLGNAEVSSHVALAVNYYGATDLTAMNRQIREVSACGAGDLGHDKPDAPEARLLGCADGVQKCPAGVAAKANPITFATQEVGS